MMFKRIRTDLDWETGGNQISWEHTSLIGDIQLNPKTIEDGAIYSIDALTSSKYFFDIRSPLIDIVDLLESGNKEKIN